MISQQGGLGRDGTTKWDQVKIIPDELPDYGATGEHQCGCTVVKLQLTLNNTGANCTGPLIHKFFFLNALMVGHPYPPVSHLWIQLTMGQKQYFFLWLGIQGCSRLTVCIILGHFI